MYTTQRIRDFTFTNEDNKLVTVPGWAFIDVMGKTIIQVYGEKKVKVTKEYLGK
jgi:hypothetical protein